ncbi:hypothetical protein LX16_5292 [Stackebrandtia albiflava]|uniref:AAA+ ATPase domain-containing protein n=1 Tax=Stackebrandtia albiflava TaxID=406432 RepID=A0A562UL34_9ACTN|nr:ATP-binding protein [Stackebrandtia albiflava]TWJ06328.1 hypothetical protein LX16_5292 [Stackebrandtia albiflava]
MSNTRHHFHRHATTLVAEALDDTRVVVIEGARQTGKSTLAELCVSRQHNSHVKYLDDPQTRHAAQADPVEFLTADGTVLVDEVQLVPDLWLAIKYLVDRDPRPGRFLLTGSARLLALKQIPAAMPGRAETIELWPLSQGEILGMPDRFVDAVFNLGSELRVGPSDVRRSDYVQLAKRGGFPEAVRRETPRRRSRFFSGYLNDLMVRDVHQVADIERPADMRRLVELLAAQSAGLLNQQRLSNDLASPASTIGRYLAILETIYLIQQIPAWSSGATGRAVKRPKLVFTDPGLAAHLVAGAFDDRTTGGLIETFVLGELTRQLSWCDTDARLYHYRDRDGHEIDAILEDSSGRVVAIEVKSSGMVRAEDLRSLNHLRDRLGDRFHAGVVLYTGSEQYSLGPGIRCIPISSLWTTDSDGATHRSEESGQS